MPQDALASPVHPDARLQLPNRIRTTAAPCPDIGTRLALADRIADFPGIVVSEAGDNVIPSTVSVMLALPVPARRGHPADNTLCEISADGILVRGLNNWEQNQVVMRGWGRLRRRGVQLHMPRNAHEIDICIRILERAHRSLANQASDTPRRATSVWAVPRIAR